MVTYLLHEPACPLCGHHDREPLVPTVKFSDHGYATVLPAVSVSVCLNCGLIHEFPQVNLVESKDYTEKHYYNQTNRIADHDAMQRRLNPLRWAVLQSLLPWSGINRAIDVGASGAWSAWVKRQHPSASSVLVEPSAEAIAWCRAEYPEVEAHHAIIETYRDPVGACDLITFFYSLYMLSDPLETLRRCHDLLSDEGRLVICISHVLLETKIWGHGRVVPWVDMEFFVRGAPLVYYSRHSLARMVETAGFHVLETLVDQLPTESEHNGRQEYYLIARRRRPDDPPAQPLPAPEHVAWSRSFVLDFCRRASEKSVALLFQSRPISRIHLVYDDAIYRDWVLDILRPHGVPVETHRLDPDNPGIPDGVKDEPGVVLLNSSPVAIGAGKFNASARHAHAAACVAPWKEGQYGYYADAENGRRVFTKAFLPIRDHGADIFPFDVHPIDLVHPAPESA